MTSHRFRVVFQSDASSLLPITLTSVKAQLQNAGVSVSWTTQNEVNVKDTRWKGQWTEAQPSAALPQPRQRTTEPLQPLASYTSFDAAPVKGDNFYRIRVEGVDGKVTYSNVVKVTVEEDGSGKTLITLYPNPVSRREGKAWLNCRM